MNWLDFSGVDTSLIIERPDDEPLCFPTRDDYYAYLKGQGLVHNRFEFVSERDIVINVHRDWHHRAAQGCRFARRMSWDPEPYGWHRLVVSGEKFSGLSDADLQVVAEPVERAFADANNAALSLIFPEVEKPNQLAALIRFLSRLPGWTGLVIDRDEKLVNIGLRVIIDRDKGVLSWPLAFGPFDFLPNTRRGPFTEVVLATKSKTHPTPKEIREKENDCAAHLADTWPVLGMKSRHFSLMWKNTEKWKRAVLGDSALGDHTRAKARVTVSIPVNAWEKSRGVV